MDIFDKIKRGTRNVTKPLRRLSPRPSERQSAPSTNDPSLNNNDLPSKAIQTPPSEPKPLPASYGLGEKAALISPTRSAILSPSGPLAEVPPGTAPMTKDFDTVQSPIFVLTPPSGSAVLSGSELSAKETAWAGLKMLTGVLKQSALDFGPLKSAFDGVFRFVDIFERTAKSRKDYDMLMTELDSIFNDLSGYMTGPAPSVMTDSVQNLVKGIEQELERVEGKRQRKKTERLLEAMEDEDEVILCYRHIRTLLERLALNANVNIWKTVDEQATDRLRSLAHSAVAQYDSADATDLRREGCTPNTRVEVLKRIADWADDLEGEKIYWLNGMAGTGKTTISYSLCDRLESSRKLGASFFCSRQRPECRNVNLIIPTIAYQLARFSLPFRYALSRTLEAKPDEHTRQLPKQFQKLIVEPLQMARDTMPADVVVVIDALDECDKPYSVRKMLETLLAGVSNLPLKLFLTSRPEYHIRNQMLNRPGERDRFELHLHDIESSIVREDIETYLQFKLQRMELSSGDLERLVEQSCILFIYTATLVRYIGAHDSSRSSQRLNQVLNSPTTTPSRKDRTVDALYTTILEPAFDDEEIEDEEKYEMQLMFHTVMYAQEPLTVGAIARLFNIDNKTSIRAALSPLLSILHISRTSEVITTLHASFLDYIFHPGRSHKFHRNTRQHNRIFIQKCFGLIRVIDPPFNICKLESSYCLDEEVLDLANRVKKAVPEELFYACQYWETHLELAETSLTVLEAYRDFLSTRLLVWMEVLNLKQRMHAEHWLFRRYPRALKGRVEIRGWIFIEPNFTQHAHIYISALPFWPHARPILKYYTQSMQDLPKATGMGMKRREVVPLAICSVPSPTICVAYSPCSTRIVSGSRDGDIRFWDAHTGQAIGKPLEGHTGAISSVAYSSDSAHIVSGSSDKTIRIWDAHAGRMTGEPLMGHTNIVTSVAYSVVGARIISGSYDKTIRIWDAHTGLMIGEPLEGHTGYVTSVAYSFNNTRIISGSFDKTIRIWDARTGRMIGTPLEGHAGRVNSVAYSCGSAHIVSGSDDKTIRIWDAHTGRMIGGPLEGHTSEINSVTYSSDGTYIISGSWDYTIRIWDAHTGHMIGKPLDGHAGTVNSVAYSCGSAHIVSGSDDKTIQIWDAHTGRMICKPLEGHTSGLASNGSSVTSPSWLLQ